MQNSMPEGLPEDEAFDDAHDAEDPLIGKILNERYKILELIGSGGWGNVYQSKLSSYCRCVGFTDISQSADIGTA